MTKRTKVAPAVRSSQESHGGQFAWETGTPTFLDLYRPLDDRHLGSRLRGNEQGGIGDAGVLGDETGGKSGLAT